MRNTCAQLKAQKFLEDKEYQGMEVWDLKYISTSDEEDNDSSETSSSEDSNEEEKKELPSHVTNVNGVLQLDEIAAGDPKTIWKMTPGKNEGVPEIAQKLRPAKKKQRIYYAYTYDNKTEEGGSTSDPKKVKVIKKRVERRQPENLIDILVM